MDEKYWDIVIADMKKECIERTSVLVEPTLYFELKFLLQMTSLIDMEDKADKAVLAIKSRLKLLSLAVKVGWKTVYDHFEIDHHAAGETRKINNF